MILEALLELNYLKDKKNLLAFSGGVDSTALFFILQRLNIDFDLALVNYQTRVESNEEENYAKELTKKFNKKCFVTKAPKFKNNFENRAREFRYRFFESLISKYHYQNLLTAHHLGDKVEWFLMQFIKGAGLVELIGMESKSSRVTSDGFNYFLIRPLLNLSKNELLKFLEDEKHRYFIDNSNLDKKFLRNRIRKEFASKLLLEYQDGIKKSFEYMQRDCKFINSCFTLKKEIKDLAIFELKDSFCIDRATDSYLKKKGVVLSSKERAILIEKGKSQISRNWVAQTYKNLLFISPFINNINIPKKFREKCRVAKIPPAIRGYIYKEKILDKLKWFI